MPYCIGNRFLSNAVEGIGNAQGYRPLVALPLNDNLNRTALDHASRTMIEGSKNVFCLECLRAKRGNTAACFFMTVTDQVTGQVELLKRRGLILRQTVANRMQLKADAGKALG